MGDINAVYDGNDFDSSQVEPSTPHEPVPAGWYAVMIEEIKVKPTKSGTGYILELDLQVVDGEFNGRHMWDRITLRNQSQKAEQIGLRQFSALCRAAGVLTVKDSSQLKDKVVMAKAKVEHQEGYEPQNKISGYKSTEGVSPAAPAATTATAAPAATAATTTAKSPVASAAPARSTPPWKK